MNKLILRCFKRFGLVLSLIVPVSKTERIKSNEKKALKAMNSFYGAFVYVVNKTTIYS